MESYHREKVLAESRGKKTLLARAESDGSLWVIKQFRVQKGHYEQALHEVKMMRRLKHQNILVCRETYRSKTNAFNIVLEYGDGGNLETYLKQRQGVSLEESKVLDIFLQVAKAVEFIHNQQTVHRDVKPRNIFLMKSGVVKLGGFDISKYLETDKTQTMIGTPLYLSPEVVRGLKYSYSVDIWSLGVLLYELCTQDLPFYGTKIRDLGFKIVKDDFQTISKLGYSWELQELLSSMLRKDPNTRPNISEILSSRVFNKRIQLVREPEETSTFWRPRMAPEPGKGVSEIMDSELKEESSVHSNEVETRLDIGLKWKPSPVSVDSDPISPDDFPFSETKESSVSTAFQTSFADPNHLHLYLNMNLGEERATSAYDIIKTAMQESGSPRYSTSVYGQLLDGVLDRKEMVLYIPLIKILITQDEARS